MSAGDGLFVLIGTSKMLLTFGLLSRMLIVGSNDFKALCKCNGGEKLELICVATILWIAFALVWWLIDWVRILTGSLSGNQDAFGCDLAPMFRMYL